MVCIFGERTGFELKLALTYVLVVYISKVTFPYQIVMQGNHPVSLSIRLRPPRHCYCRIMRCENIPGLIEAVAFHKAKLQNVPKAENLKLCVGD